MQAVQAVDDVQSLLIRLKCLDGLRKPGLRQRAAAGHAFRNAGRRVEALVLHEEDDPPGHARTGGGCLCEAGRNSGTNGSTDAGCHSLKHVSATEHSRSFKGANVMLPGLLFRRCQVGFRWGRGRHRFCVAPRCFLRPGTLQQGSILRQTDGESIYRCLRRRIYFNRLTKSTEKTLSQGVTTMRGTPAMARLSVEFLLHQQNSGCNRPESPAEQSKRVDRPIPGTGAVWRSRIRLTDLRHEPSKPTSDTDRTTPAPLIPGAVVLG